MLDGKLAIEEQDVEPSSDEIDDEIDIISGGNNGTGVGMNGNHVKDRYPNGRNGTNTNHVGVNVQDRNRISAHSTNGNRNAKHGNRNAKHGNRNARHGNGNGTHGINANNDGLHGIHANNNGVPCIGHRVHRSSPGYLCTATACTGSHLATYARTTCACVHRSPRVQVATVHRSPP